MNKTKTKAAILTLSGVVLVAVFGLLVLRGSDRPVAVTSTTVLVVLGALAFTLLTVGVSMLVSARKAAAGELVPTRDYSHTYLLFALVALGLLAAVSVREFMVPDSWGQYGQYRGSAVEEAMAREPRHMGEANCVGCHKEEVRLHDKDVHATVECEVCHGPAGDHVKDPTASVQIPSGKEPCLGCHQALAARPGSFPQIDWRKHYEFVGVKDDNLDCTKCHSGHEPLYLDRDLRNARLHPLVHRCGDCHVGRTDDSLERPEGHPEIFECSYCHRELVEDFEDREHAEVGCTTCHLFIKQTSFSGRIIRDADPRFCLLCHREAEFRSDSAPPGIPWPEHLEDVMEEEEDRNKRCIDCHRDRIHPPAEGGDNE